MVVRAALTTLLLLGALHGCSDSNDDDDAEQPPPPEPPPANTEDFDVTLSPREVVGGSDATGTGNAEVTVNLDDGTVTGTVTLTDVDAEAVTLREGFAGENGEELVSLDETAPGDWAFPADATLTEADLERLEAGGMHLVASTAEAPDGMLRGQIVPEGIELRFVELSGAQEVPPVTTSASAVAALTLDRASETLVLHMNTSGLDDAAEAHIHDGLAGVNGPILIGLVRDPDDVSHWMLDELVLEPAQLDALDAAGLYVNVHTPEHPAGEVRGQIGADGVEIFFTPLSGDEVVPPVDSDAAGVAAGTLVTDSRTLTLHVNLSGLDDAETVAVHQAPLMQNGPAVFELTRDPNEVTHWLIEDRALTEAEHQALRSQELYVLVTSPALPDGELRGQLAPQDSSGGSGEAFVVTAVEPEDGATVDALPDALTATFNRDVLADSATPDRVAVTASGGDGGFDDGNELMVGVLTVEVSGNQLTAELDTNAASDDVYQVLLDGSSDTPLTDSGGTPLDGDGDGTAGGDFVSTFTVEAGTSAPTLSELQAEIFTPSCAKSGCHAGSAPAQGMDLSEGATFASTVNVPSLEVPELDRVEPRDPDQSYLVRKVEGTASVGGRMPLDGPPFLSESQIQQIRDWISAGAEDD
ncbi:MAG TPA: CHRD domain-containing protein [Pseudomonadales bacterium]